jgi:TetR/AcrR family transcriptional regulator, repressor for neighboring sulfatase
VRRAAIDAATQLFAERGISAVSVREVAAEAGVNPSLVHRYVGGKDALLRAVLAELLDRLRPDLEAFTDEDLLPDRPETAIATHQRIAAHMVIEGRDIRDFQSAFPVTRFIIDEIQRIEGVDAHTARVRGAQIYALDLAVRLFEPVLLQAAGLGTDDADALRRAVRRISFGIGHAG